MNLDKVTETLESIHKIDASKNANDSSEKLNISVNRCLKSWFQPSQMFGLVERKKLLAWVEMA